MRLVGAESRKTYLDKINNGFFLRFCRGKGAEIGYEGYIENTVTILPDCIGIDKSTPGYNGFDLPFAEKSLDFLYSSHTLEHISDRKNTIKEWFRVLKVGGFMVTVVPHQWLYEKKAALPSQFNEDHKIFYTPAILLKEFEESLPINSFRVRHLRENDKNHDYQQSNTEHSKGEYEIEFVIEKI